MDCTQVSAQEFLCGDLNIFFTVVLCAVLEVCVLYWSILTLKPACKCKQISTKNPYADKSAFPQCLFLLSSPMNILSTVGGFWANEVKHIGYALIKIFVHFTCFKSSANISAYEG